MLFSSAQDAAAFFATSVQTWTACSKRQLTAAPPGQSDAVLSAGPIRNAKGVLSAPLQYRTASNRKVNCARALTVVNDLVIDVQACDNVDAGLEAFSADTIAREIAAKAAQR